MSLIIHDILRLLNEKSPIQAKRLMEMLKHQDEKYFQRSEVFFSKYVNFLRQDGKSIEYSVDCFLKMIADMVEERIKFIGTGKYSNTSFEAVNIEIYSKPEVMQYHMHGLAIAQFLWSDQYLRFDFFSNNFNKYFKAGNAYLEVGGGHGLYFMEAINQCPMSHKFDCVDISSTSIEIARNVVGDCDRVNFFVKDIFDFKPEGGYDFITIGEVIEHLEDPLSMVRHLHNLLKDDGVIYLTTPANAPMIDHIFLFHNANDIRTLINEAGFNIIEERSVYADGASKQVAEKYKLPLMYAAFINKM